MATKTSSVFFKESSPSTPEPLKYLPKTAASCTPQNVRQKTPLTPSRARTTPGDRYVPRRAERDLEFARFQLSTPSRNSCRLTENISNSPTSCEENRALMRDKLLALKGQSTESRVLSLRQQVAPSGTCKSVFLCNGNVSAFHRGMRNACLKMQFQKPGIERLHMGVVNKTCGKIALKSTGKQDPLFLRSWRCQCLPGSVFRALALH